ncbi:MAG: hypothetical protein ACRDI1_04905 [Actinomycetota bacterium]
MKDLRKVLLVALLLSLVAAALVSPVSAQETVLTYTIKEARAYGYKISVTKEVIEISRQAPCDPETDPYQCDKNRYERTPNCPSEVAIGPAGAAPKAAAPPGTPLESGGAGATLGTSTAGGRAPPGASPVKINELLATAHIARAGDVGEAGGTASDTFVDLDGRGNPNAHAESDAFIPNKNVYEERCDPAASGSYVHVLSRSFQTPEVYNLAECRREQCSRSGSTEGRPQVNEATSIVHVFERDGKVFGQLRATVSKLSFPGSPLAIGALKTFVAFESDGTPEGLKWSAGTSATGVTVAGQPVPAPPGEAILGPGFAAGVSGPYVLATEDGSQLTIIAPGFFYGTDAQTTYAAGAEIYVGLGRAVPFSFSATDLSSGSFTPLQPGLPAFQSRGSGAAPPPAPAPPSTGDPLAVSVEKVSFDPWAAGAILGLAVTALLIMLLNWMRRFEFGRRLYRIQPLRSLNWMYRAFLRT